MFYTFGPSHRHPDTGESLDHCYVEIRLPYEAARYEMMRHFGRYWAFGYPEADGQRGAGVNKYNLRRVEMPSIARFDFRTGRLREGA